MYLTDKILGEILEILDEELEYRFKKLSETIYDRVLNRLNELQAQQTQELEAKIEPIVNEYLEDQLDLRIKLLKPVQLENNLFTLVKKPNQEGLLELKEIK